MYSTVMDQFKASKKKYTFSLVLIILSIYVVLYEDGPIIDNPNKTQFHKNDVLVERDIALASLNSSITLNTALELELSKYKEKITDTKSRNQNLEDKISTLKSRLTNLTEIQKTGGVGDKLASPDELFLFEPHELCSKFPTASFTATHMWQKYVPSIIKASDISHLSSVRDWIPKDNGEKLRYLLEEVLLPSRMRRSVLHTPTFNHAGVKNIIEILQKRIQDPDKHPPLKIAVFGGSVTLGRGACTVKKFRHPDCAWPKRFELLVNQFLGVDVVKVYNLALGGTGSRAAMPMMKYWMYDDSSLYESGPDVIINSYSTNDSLPPWDSPTDKRITSVTNKVLKSIQEFIREALKSKPCGVPPLVVHVDDYLGPQQAQVLGEMSYNTMLVQLAKWYDTVAFSYGDVVRDIVYNNTSDPTFFNEKDVHYGFYAHQAISWAVSFGSLELLSNYCDDEYSVRKKALLSTRADVNAPSVNTATPVRTTDMSNIELQRNATTSSIFERKILPPRLSSVLMLKNVTLEWKKAQNDAILYNKDDVNCSNTIKDQSPCETAWFVSSGDYQKRKIDQFLQKYISVNNGWGVGDKDMSYGWANKMGFETTVPSASFTLTFHSLTKDVKTWTVFYMTSYGEKWEGSKARFTAISGKGDDVRTLLESDIKGYHNVTASVTQPMKLVFSDTVRKGDTLNLKVDLVSGKTFKIQGMALCIN